MKIKTKTTALPILMGFLLIIQTIVFTAIPAAAEKITLTLNDSYQPGEVVELTGKAPEKANQLVALEVKDADGNTILIRTVQIDSDGNFVLKFKLPSSAKAGKLNVIASSGAGESTVTETKTVTLATTSSAQQSGQSTTEKKGGGCLIATAAFGSELVPQIQQLRETRDRVLYHTQSGTSFMTAFNQFYYTFSPTIADWERQNPIFKEVVKITITPMITTLSILNYLNIDSEEKMLGYGIGIILLNIAMYFVAPIVVIMRLRQH